MANDHSFNSKLRVVAGIAISDGKVFMARRSPNRAHAGLWEFPGGKVEIGESDQIALKREFKEEFGIEVVVNELLDMVDVDILLCGYFVEMNSNPLFMNSHTEWAFLNADQINLIPSPETDKVLIQKLIKLQILKFNQ